MRKYKIDPIRIQIVDFHARRTSAFGRAMNSFLVLPLTHLKHFTFHFRFGMPGAWAGQGRAEVCDCGGAKKRMGHQMHEFGSLLSCDFACNPNIWS